MGTESVGLVAEEAFSNQPHDSLDEADVPAMLIQQTSNFGTHKKTTSKSNLLKNNAPMKCFEERGTLETQSRNDKRDVAMMVVLIHLASFPPIDLPSARFSLDTCMKAAADDDGLLSPVLSNSRFLVTNLILEFSISF